MDLILDSNSQYAYANSRPLFAPDAYGLSCHVKSFKQIYDGEIADLDSEVVRKSYSVLADSAHAILATQVRKLDGLWSPTLQIPEQTGVGPGIATNGSRGLVYFLFFLQWEVLETNPGDCRFFIRENAGYHTKRNFGKAKWQVTQQQNQLEKTPPAPPLTAGDIAIDTPVNRQRDCNKRVIFVDAPRCDARTGPFGYSCRTIINQTWIVQDASNNNQIVSTETTKNILIGAKENDDPKLKKLIPFAIEHEVGGPPE